MVGGNQVLHSRCDSFVAETDVHYPTDKNLRDAIQKIIQLIALECSQFGITAKRQMEQIQRRVVNGKKNPIAKKIFSLFEPHTSGSARAKPVLLKR